MTIHHLFSSFSFSSIKTSPNWTTGFQPSTQICRTRITSFWTTPPSLLPPSNTWVFTLWTSSWAKIVQVLLYNIGTVFCDQVKWLYWITSRRNKINCCSHKWISVWITYSQKRCLNRNKIHNCEIIIMGKIPQQLN